eukprot:TRINITY_DN1912_c0_g2_i1.p1 TRINITY_DN1912_c0_g2~~TRINITY_DN1912_c0_g2_i1.p1  ORF type:complete len:154 (+),score=25.37 TRINITY_DN1912_c0_g2_i1:1047-1508(+)
MVPTILLEILPKWNIFHDYFLELKFVDAGRYVVFLIFTSMAFCGLTGLARFSDSLTLELTLKLSLLAPLVVNLVTEYSTASGDDHLRRLIIDNPLKTAGVLGFFTLLIYWIVRIFTLSCCHKAKEKAAALRDLAEESYGLENGVSFSSTHSGN